MPQLESVYFCFIHFNLSERVESWLPGHIQDSRMELHPVAIYRRAWFLHLRATIPQYLKPFQAMVCLQLGHVSWYFASSRFVSFRIYFL